MRRLFLLRHALTAETRRAAFPTTTGATVREPCESLEPAGWTQARELAPHLPRIDRCWTSHARRARETAEGLGLKPELALAELAEGDFGRWAGRTLDEVHASEPAELAAWFANPASTPHGGEPLASIRARAAVVMMRAAAVPGTTLLITHGGLIRAAFLSVLDLSAATIWHLDCAPGSLTEFHPSDEGWRLVRLNWTPTLASPIRSRGAAPSDD